MATITIDANIYISALNFGGRPLRLLEQAIAGEVEVAVSEPILDEVRRVLRNKFEWSEERVRQAESLIGSFALHVTPDQTVDVVKEDPYDNRILECAVASRSEFIVTGDRDLLRVGEFEGIKMTRVSEFLAGTE